jgi:hypothetical protein
VSSKPPGQWSAHGASAGGGAGPSDVDVDVERRKELGSVPARGGDLDRASVIGREGRDERLVESPQSSVLIPTPTNDAVGWASSD